jgi:predicted DsbA family dithiol-disulfide isomerase
MSDPFFIDLWSDVVCPFCYLGARQLQLALDRFENVGDVVIRHRAFELDPKAPTDYDLSLPELLAKKYSMPIERAKALNDRLEGEASVLGMTWSMKDARPTNTFDAHRVIALSVTQELDQVMSERLFRAYFCEGQLVSDRVVLTALANEVGVVGVEELWSSDAFSSAVRADEDDARELGITGVPSLLLDEKFMVVGAQGADQILDVLQRAWARRAAA